MNFTLASDDPNIKIDAILESLRILETGGTVSSGLANALSSNSMRLPIMSKASRRRWPDGQNLIAAAQDVIDNLSQ